LIIIIPSQKRCYRFEHIAIEDLQNGEEFQLRNGKKLTIHDFPKLLARCKTILLFYDTINGGEVDVSAIKPAPIP